MALKKDWQKKANEQDNEEGFNPFNPSGEEIKRHDPENPIWKRFHTLEDLLDSEPNTYDMYNWAATFNDRAGELAVVFSNTVEKSRERELALTALEEFQMWAQKAMYKPSTDD